MRVRYLCDILKRHGISCGAGVPCSYFTPLVNQMVADPGMDYVSAASEGEAVAIAAGLTAAGRQAFALMQNSGLGNAVNPITSLLQTYQIPVVLLVSHRGEPGMLDEPQHELMGRITEDLARLCGLRTSTFESGSFSRQLAAALGDGVPAAWIVTKGSLDDGPSARPVRPVFHSTAVSPGSEGAFCPSLTREGALRAILPVINRGLGDHGGSSGPAVVATTGKLSRELYELDDGGHDRCNRFYMVGSMGCAAGFGLGVALGRPNREVIVLDGDGAALMKLGTMATIGHTSPANFHHVVFDNGAHDSTGGQPTSSPTADFAAIALACGYKVADTVDNGPRLSAVLGRHLEHEGPTLLRAAIVTGSRDDLGRPRLGPRDGWLRFCGFLRGESAGGR